MDPSLTTPTTSTIKEHTLAELEQLYIDAKSVDTDVFAEMRSNLLLIHGEHYNRARAATYQRLRRVNEVSEEQRLRLTKNHIQKIWRGYTNNIMSAAPGVGFTPRHENELDCQKSAELHESVWQDGITTYGIDDLIDDWCDDYVGIGEVAVKIFWDPMGGKLKGHYQATDDQGQPLWDQETSEPVRGDAVYTGGFIVDTIQGYNLLRDPACKDIRKSPYLIEQAMIKTATLKEKFPKVAEKIVESADETMKVFDGGESGYRNVRDETLLRSHFFRSCPQYPNGYFYFFTKEVICAKGELPGGIFPVIVRRYDRLPSSARGRGPVKIMRPYQVEINRASSKMAEHQVSLGDDKLLIQDGTAISEGVVLPGVRSVNYQGMKPEILPGRNGSQYLAYATAQIAELYQVMNMPEELEENTAQLDPYAMLFKAASKKRKFQRNIRGFEKFLTEVAETYVELARIHLPDDAMIYAVGKQEQVNIAEFKNASKDNYKVKATPQTDDIESKFGHQLAIDKALQYVGGKMEKEDIGKLMRMMPFGNFDESFSDMTLDYDLGTNMILALDRGDQVQVNKYDSHPYLIKRLSSRTRKPDFRFMAPNIQQAYDQQIAFHEQAEAQKQMQIQAADAGYIPTDGYLAKCDMYVPDPNDPTAAPQKLQLPFGALKWLNDTLTAQGRGQSELQAMNTGNQAEIAGMMHPPGQGMPPGAPGAPPPGAPGPMMRPQAPNQFRPPSPAPSGAPFAPGMPRPQLPPGRPGMPLRPGMPPMPQPNMQGPAAMGPRSF